MPNPTVPAAGTGLPGETAPRDLRGIIFDMEDDVYRLRRIASVLNHVGGSPHMVEAGAIHVTAEMLEMATERLLAQWKALWVAAGLGKEEGTR